MVGALASLALPPPRPAPTVRHRRQPARPALSYLAARAGCLASGFQLSTPVSAIQTFELHLQLHSRTLPPWFWFTVLDVDTAAATMEALRKSEARLTVYVHPSNAADARGAVALQLSTLLFSYEERFGGMLLAHEFKSGRKDTIKAKIMNGLVPYFGVPVDATLLLFSPQPGMILEGKVEMLGKESIHATVLGVFSVAIMSDSIHGKFKFRRKGGGRFISWSDKEHVIKKGSLIRFSVKRVDTEMNCHMTGSLIPPHTGSRQWLSENDNAYESEINRYAAEKSSSRRRSRDINIKVEHDEENRRLNNINHFMNCDRLHKMRKRSFDERKYLLFLVQNVC